MINNTVVKKTMLLLDLFKLKITLINIIAISAQFEKKLHAYIWIRKQLKNWPFLKISTSSSQERNFKKKLIKAEHLQRSTEYYALLFSSSEKMQTKYRK